jgi:orotate phosphoribosyltransferase
MLAEKDIIALFERENAIWFFNYGGDPKAPHAELTSGLCSDGYVNCRIVLSDPMKVELLAHQLISLAEIRNVGKVDWVVGSAYAAITFSYEVARRMGARHGFVQKDEKDPKKMVWTNLVIPAGARVLQCEELITTFGTAQKVRDAISDGNPYEVSFLPDILTIVHRPEKFQGGGVTDILALVQREVKVWKPDQCPLCANGSPRVRPARNCAQLTGKA